jgi:ABC-type transport system involved in multi-copper enzyme maturation permease subunit
VGPLFWYDLSRLARRGRTTLVRIAYGLLLLGGLCLLYTTRFSFVLHYSFILQSFSFSPVLSAGAMARFALSAVSTIFMLQGAVVFALTPAYLATSIAEERSRRTLEFLFTTPLVNREIILGKLFSRVAFVGSVLLTGLPIVCLARLWGGIDLSFLLADFALTLLTLLSVGSISILCSTTASNEFGAVVSSYVFVVAFGLVCQALPSCSPVRFAPEFERRFDVAMQEWRDITSSSTPMSGPRLRPGMPFSAVPLAAPPDPSSIALGMFLEGAWVHLIVFFFCSRMAISRLRRDPYAERPSLRDSVRPSVQLWGPFEENVYENVYRVPYTPPIPTRKRPRVSDNALLWKELYLGTDFVPAPRNKEGELLKKLAALPRTRLIVNLLLVGGALCSLNWLSVTVPNWFSAAMPEVDPIPFNKLIRVACIILTGLWCFGTGFCAAASVSREREQGTLETLFLLPIERREILKTKWLGSVLRWRILGYILLAAVASGYVTGALHPWSVILLISSCALYVGFVASVGVWLSLASRNTIWANVSMALVLLLMFLTSGLAGGNIGQLTNMPLSLQAYMLEAAVYEGLNPARIQWLAGFSWTDFAGAVYRKDLAFGISLLAVLLSELVFGLAAGFFWLLNCLRFRKEYRGR